MERGRFQPLGEARQAVLRLIGAHRFLRPEFLYDLRQACLLSSPSSRGQHILNYVDFRMRYPRNRIDLLRMSKKANWSIVAISTLLKINNLQFMEKAQIVIFRVCRQARYISVCFSIIEKAWI
jgi:hypothetical protein